ncbi:MAG: hypothetical protein QM666_00835 [Acinetobacter sp.]
MTQTTTYGKPLAFTTLTAMVFTASIMFACHEQSPASTTISSYANAETTTYSVQALKITGDHTGIATIRLDEFILNVSFDYQAHADSYGVQGSDYTAIEITSLSIENVHSVDGKEFKDFTDHVDHQNINALLSGFIEKNRLVEAV